MRLYTEMPQLRLDGIITRTSVDRRGSNMNEYTSEHLPVTLRDSLLASGWEKNMFGYNGPSAPYVRVSVSLTWLGLEPVFQSFFRDRLFFRRSVSMREHLNRYRLIKVSDAACEDVFGRTWAHRNSFPVNEWLRIERVNATSLTLWHRGHGRLIEVETRLLCPVSEITLV